jgi:hypothetical protein
MLPPADGSRCTWNGDSSQVSSVRPGRPDGPVGRYSQVGRRHTLAAAQQQLCPTVPRVTFSRFTLLICPAPQPQVLPLRSLLKMACNWLRATQAHKEELLSSRPSGAGHCLHDDQPDLVHAQLLPCVADRAAKSGQATPVKQLLLKRRRA